MIRGYSFEEKKYLSGLFLIAGLIYCYGKTMAALFHTWWATDIYSYGFLIPLISLYLIWERREKLVNAFVNRNYILGIPVLSFALILLIIGEIGGLISLQELSLLIAIAGLVLLLFGTEVLLIAWFPMAYLLFAIPVWDFILNKLHPPFQLLSATVGVKPLQLLGIPVYQKGIYIELPDITLQVAEVCSGVSYLISVIAIGIPLAYLFLKKWGKRITLILFAVFIAILGNGIRVSLIALFAYYGYTRLHGPFAIFRACIVSAMGFVALFAGLWLLTDRESVKSALKGKKGKKIDIKYLLNRNRNVHNRLPFILALVFLIAAGSYVHFHKTEKVPLRSDLKGFPYKIGEWTGYEIDPDYKIFRSLGVDDELSRVYRSGSVQDIKLYTGYFEAQRQNKELISFKVDILFKNSTEINMRFDEDKVFRVNKLVSSEGMERNLVLFWFDVNGRILADKNLVKLYTVWDGIVHNRTNGSVIIITTEINDEEEIDGSLLMAKKFIRDLHSVLFSHLPRI